VGNDTSLHKVWQDRRDETVGGVARTGPAHAQSGHGSVTGGKIVSPEAVPRTEAKTPPNKERDDSIVQDQVVHQARPDSRSASGLNKSLGTTISKVGWLDFHNGTSSFYTATDRIRLLRICQFQAPAERFTTSSRVVENNQSVTATCLGRPPLFFTRKRSQKNRHYRPRADV